MLKLVNKFKSLFFQKNILVLLSLAILFLTFYPIKAYAIDPVTAIIVASVLVPIVTVALGAFATGLTFIVIVQGIQLLGLLAGGAILRIGISFLNWGIKGGPFAFWSMTNPSSNKIIEIGWTLSRDLTNMFFILGLAYIGLATALNFSSFNTKKTFTTLLIVALLINFTPVICGLIVDGTNIIMNFFFSEVNFDQMADSYTQLINTGGYEKVAKENLSHFEWIIKTIILQFYSFGAGLVLLIFAAILLLRTFIIWILVILSPFAFFCYIFSFSKQWFSKWWKYFIEWAFVGIPAAFFLYLGNHLLVLTKSAPIMGASETLGFWNALTPYLVSALFLLIALISTLKIKAAGSGFIMGAANKIVKSPLRASQLIGGTAGEMAGAAVGGALAAAGLKGAAKARSRSLATEEGQKWATDHPIRGAIAKANRYVFGKKDEYTNEEIKEGKNKSWHRVTARTALTPITLGATLWGRTAQSQATAALSKQQEEIGKRGAMKGKSLPEKRAFKDSLGLKSGAEQIQGVLDILEDGDAGDVWDFDNTADLDQLRNILQKAVRTSPEKFKKLRLIDFMDKDPEKDELGNITKEGRKSLLSQIYSANKDKLTKDYLDRAGLLLSDSDKKKYNSAEALKGTGLEVVDEKEDAIELIKRKLIDKGKASDVAIMNKPDLMALLKSNEFQKFGNQAQIAKAAENFASEAVDALRGIMKEKTEESPSFYYDHNPRLHNYFKSTPARTLGFSYDYDDKEKQKEKIDVLSQKMEALQDFQKEKNHIDEQIQEFENLSARHHKKEISELEYQKEAIDKNIQKVQSEIKEQENVKKQNDEAEKQKQTPPNNEQKKPPENKYKGMGRRQI